MKQAGAISLILFSVLAVSACGAQQAGVAGTAPSGAPAEEDVPPIQRAIVNGDAVAVARALERDPDGRLHHPDISAIEFALTQQPCRPEVVRALQAGGLDVENTDTLLNTWSTVLSASSGQVACTLALLELGVRSDLVDQHGSGILSYTLRMSGPGGLARLLPAATHGFAESDLAIALAFARSGGDEAVCRQVLALGASADLPVVEGRRLVERFEKKGYRLAADCRPIVIERAAPEINGEPVACGDEPIRRTLFLKSSGRDTVLAERFGGGVPIALALPRPHEESAMDPSVHVVLEFLRDPRKYEYFHLRLDATFEVECARGAVALEPVLVHESELRRYRRD